MRISNRLSMGVLALVLGCSMVGWSQESAKPKTAAKQEDKKPTNRLPANYGKLGLTDAQKDKVYAAQEKYDKQIDDLEAQIKSLKAKRDAEVEAVLSAEQKKILKDLTDEAKDTKAKAKKTDEKDKK